MIFVPVPLVYYYFQIGYGSLLSVQWSRHAYCRSIQLQCFVCIIHFWFAYVITCMLCILWLLTITYFLPRILPLWVLCTALFINCILSHSHHTLPQAFSLWCLYALYHGTEPSLLYLASNNHVHRSVMTFF